MCLSLPSSLTPRKIKPAHRTLDGVFVFPEQITSSSPPASEPFVRQTRRRTTFEFSVAKICISTLRRFRPSARSRRTACRGSRCGCTLGLSRSRNGLIIVRDVTTEFGAMGTSTTFGLHPGRSTKFASLSLRGTILFVQCQGSSATDNEVTLRAVPWCRCVLSFLSRSLRVDACSRTSECGTSRVIERIPRSPTYRGRVV